MNATPPNWIKTTVRSIVILALLIPLGWVSGVQSHELKTFSLSNPPHVDWKLMVQGPDSIWFHRARSTEEFLMIGAMAVEIPEDQWSMQNQELAQGVIQEYRNSTADSGHPLHDESFEILTINGKRFYGASAMLSTIHSMPIPHNLLAHELVYIFIKDRNPPETPHVYLFVFTDIYNTSVAFEEDLKEFHSVLGSFNVKEIVSPARF